MHQNNWSESSANYPEVVRAIKEVHDSGFANCSGSSYSNIDGEFANTTGVSFTPISVMVNKSCAEIADAYNHATKQLKGLKELATTPSSPSKSPINAALDALSLKDAITRVNDYLDALTALMSCKNCNRQVSTQSSAAKPATAGVSARM